MKQDFSFLTFKKISSKNGILTVAFLDTESNEIQIKGMETPHPDFVTKFLSLSANVQNLLQIPNDLITQPREIQFKADQATIVAELTSDIMCSEAKVTINQADAENVFVGETYDLIDEIKDEAKNYLRGKTAQLEIPFNEETTAMRAKAIYNALTKGVVNE